MNSCARACLCLVVFAALTTLAAEPGVASLDEAIASKRDLWGEAALKQTDGPSYEFFEPLLPPLRYVDAPFHHYPITLSAPGAAVKGRLVSNGSVINALARQPNWRGEAGVPVTFRVGNAREEFGADLRRLDGPKYEAGYLPIVQLRYRQEKATYAEECFASVDPDLLSHGAIFMKFTLAGGEAGLVEAQVEAAAPLRRVGGTLAGADGKSLVAFGSGWEFNPSRNTLTARFVAGGVATLVVFTEPAADAPAKVAATYDEERRLAAEVWTRLLDGGMQLTVAEPRVNDAWRSLVVGSYALLKEDDMRYSAGNQYAKLYEAEGGDAVRALLLYGHAADARRMIVPLMDYTRKGLEFHQGAFKLQLLANYYWVTRDVALLREQRARWQKEVDLLVNGREKESGLFPREKYCGDIDTRVYSLNSNANGWRALRDMAAVLADATELGEVEQAERLKGVAAEFRARVLAALEKSVRRDVDPPFVPIGLFGEEAPYDVIAASRMGSYWNIMSTYVLGSGVFRHDSETATGLIRYVQNRGGRFAGQNRAFPEKSFWMEQSNVNDLYGMRYALTLLERDEADAALVCFYGKLALGMTRDTFIGSEGSCLRPVDEFGRQMYLPPNSAANANFLQQLRYLLVQDLDLDDDGRPETLRLGFATPRRWLVDGAEIKVSGAATAFGEVGFSIRSDLAHGKVEAEVSLPARAPSRTLLRFRLPGGWRVESAAAGDAALGVAADGETVDLTGLSGRAVVHATVKRVTAK
ncbi:MAG: hypothetical protein JWN40_3388 [Phycisphaerales bacterium]|nr:hypothetical protein [Phycisphaerales bacterium]